MNAGIYRGYLCWVKKNRVQGCWNGIARPTDRDDPREYVTDYGHNQETALVRLRGSIDRRLDQSQA